ncbi:CinA family protein [Sulfitobacter donghicola]|nr:CinA family protein [Sulfitobacter donghicola]KIN69724.1 Competence/damage-inducible protein CinA domain protein [Sulfitobacter donghicola DSW-25 = KCTC 12864 = JCM 14565]
MRSEILDLAKQRGVMIATAESCTAGMVAAALTDLAGSSAVFERGFVTYTNRAKIEMLGVQQQTLEAHGAVSEQVAQEMAQGALRNSGAQLTVSLTGIAGPGGSEHKPEGRVCFGVASADGCFNETVEFGALGREAVRCAARDHALGLLQNALLQMPPK